MPLLFVAMLRFHAAAMLRLLIRCCLMSYADMMLFDTRYFDAARFRLRAALCHAVSICFAAISLSLLLYAPLMFFAICRDAFHAAPLPAAMMPCHYAMLLLMLV